jgi:hypothetical protein
VARSPQPAREDLRGAGPEAPVHGRVAQAGERPPACIARTEAAGGRGSLVAAHLRRRGASTAWRLQGAAARRMRPARPRAFRQVHRPSQRRGRAHRVERPPAPHLQARRLSAGGAGSHGVQHAGGQHGLERGGTPAPSRRGAGCLVTRRRRNRGGGARLPSSPGRDRACAAPLGR